MLKTLAAQVKEYKKDSLLTPLFMVLEVLMEMIITSYIPATVLQHKEKRFCQFRQKRFFIFSVPVFKKGPGFHKR